MTISYEHNLDGNVVVVVQIPTTAMHTRTSADVKVTIDYGGKEARDPKYAIPPARIELTTSESRLTEFVDQLSILLRR